MPGFLVNPEDVTGDKLIIRDDEAHHLVRVRRHGVGDLVDVLDGNGRLFRVLVESEERGRVYCRVVQCTQEGGESAVRLHLATSMIKGNRFGLIVEKGTEVGIASISAFVSERTVFTMGTETKRNRWERLVVAAAKQCDRSRVPRVYEPAPLAEIVDKLSCTCELVLMAHHNPGGNDLKDVLGTEPRVEMGLLVGPEGGFTTAEINAAENAGVRTFSWGTRNLRTETACIVLAGIVIHEAESNLIGGE